LFNDAFGGNEEEEFWEDMGENWMWVWLHFWKWVNFW